MKLKLIGKELRDQTGVVAVIFGHTWASPIGRQGGYGFRVLKPGAEFTAPATFPYFQDAVKAARAKLKNT